MNNKSKVISLERAGEIALELVKYYAARREYTLNEDSGRKEDSFEGKAAKLGVDPAKLKIFHANVILPVVLAKHFDRTAPVPLHIQLGQLRTEDTHQIAIRLMEARGVHLSPVDIKKNVKAVSESTGVPVEDLISYYIGHMLPKVIAQLAGWDYCIISETPTATSAAGSE